MNRIDKIINEIINNEEMTALKHDYQAIADLFNLKPKIDNPESQEQVPKKLTIKHLFGAITPSEARKLYMIPGFRHDVQVAAENGDRESLEMYIAIAGDDLSNESKLSLLELMNQTEQDSQWNEFIDGDSLADSLSVSAVTARDVQEALNYHDTRK